MNECPFLTCWIFPSLSICAMNPSHSSSPEFSSWCCFSSISLSMLDTVVVLRRKGTGGRFVALNNRGDGEEEFCWTVLDLGGKGGRSPTGLRLLSAMDGIDGGWNKSWNKSELLTVKRGKLLRSVTVKKRYIILHLWWATILCQF